MQLDPNTCYFNHGLVHVTRFIMIVYTVFSSGKVKIYVTSQHQCDALWMYKLSWYSKTCVKMSLKNRQNKGLNDKW